MRTLCLTLLALVLPVNAALAVDAGEFAYVAKDTTSERFLGERTPGPGFEEGMTVKVLAVEGAKARVVVGDRFGWVDVAALGPVPEAPATPPVIQLEPSTP